VPAAIRNTLRISASAGNQLSKLQTFGLLNNSFQPTDEIRIARTLWRQRGG